MSMSKINIYLKTKCESYPFEAYRISHSGQGMYFTSRKPQKGHKHEALASTVQYSAAHTVATLNSAFLSFGKALVHRRKKTDKFMLTRLLKVLCSMEKRLHFLHTHNSLRKKIVQVFFYEFLSPTAFLPPSMFSLASRRQAKRATGTSWPDQVALARQLSGLAGTAVYSVLVIRKQLTQNLSGNIWPQSSQLT